MSGGPAIKGTFEARAEDELAKARLRQAIPAATEQAVASMQELFAGRDREALRERGAAIRDELLADWDGQIARLTAACEAQGVVVHHAVDAADARRIVRGICRDIGARSVVKSKSMLSEEIDLNRALEADGVRVVETDLGEYLVQLGGDRPSHLIAPAVHLDLEQARSLLSRVARRELPPEPAALAGVAREHLRREFLAADVGVTGVNFGVAESGTLVVVENEGNARLATSLPRVHVALMGIERIVPRLVDLAVLLPLLTGHGTGQEITCYVSFVQGGRRAGEPGGPEHQHLVLVDNGRRALGDSEYASVLRCIRCGACQNICPIFRQVGGHAYGWVYGGPVGAVLTPLLEGSRAGGEVAYASSLCAACDDICPVKIPLHDLLLRLRRRYVESGSGALRERIAFALWGQLWSRLLLYRLSRWLAHRVLAAAGWPGAVRVLRRVAGRWTAGRALPPPGRRSAGRR